MRCRTLLAGKKQSGQKLVTSTPIMLADGNPRDHDANISMNNYASIHRHTEYVVDTISPFPAQTKFGCNLTQLRLFIEHCLIQNEVAGKSMDCGSSSDPCWCAWQHYLSGLNEHYNEYHKANHSTEYFPVPEEAIDDLAAGWNPKCYPDLSLCRLHSFLDPFHVLDGSRTAMQFEFKDGQRPKLGPPLSASAVASHFQTPPANILRLEFYRPSGRRIPILDDGQTKTLVYNAYWNKNESVVALLNLPWGHRLIDLW